MGLTFDRAIEVLEITDISAIKVENLPRLKRKMMARWHPDSVAHLKNPALTEEYTVNSQEVEPACEMIKAFLNGDYQADQDFYQPKQSPRKATEEILKDEAPGMQETLNNLWTFIKERKYKWSVEEVIRSDGFKLRDLLDNDLKEDIALKSVVSLFYGIVFMGILSLIVNSFSPVLSIIVQVIWSLQALSCILGFIPLSRVWMAPAVTGIVLKFINFGLGIYFWAEEQGQKSSKNWVILLISIPMIFGKLIKYVILWPLTELAKVFVGDRVVGVVKQNINYYANFQEQYIDHLLSTDPELLTTDELYNLSELYTELSDVKSATFHEPYQPQQSQQPQQTQKEEPIFDNSGKTRTATTQVHQMQDDLQAKPRSFDLASWYERNKKSVLVAAAGIIGLLLMITAARFLLSIDFSKKETVLVTPSKDSIIREKKQAGTMDQTKSIRSAVLIDTLSAVWSGNDSMEKNTIKSPEETATVLAANKSEIASTEVNRDKPKVVKPKDGKETFYYGENRQPLQNESGAKYYRVVNYRNGKISGSVKEYYISSGRLAMVGFYEGEVDEDRYRNGLFTYYYENGQRSSEARFVNGKQNGKYLSWYASGGKMEDVNYTDGQKDGCDMTWNENGDPKIQSVKSRDYFDFYSKGQIDINRQECLAVTSTGQRKNKTETTKPISDYSVKATPVTTAAASNYDLNKILYSTYRGAVVKDYLTGRTGIFSDRKSGSTQPGNTIFMFINKDNEIVFQNELTRHITGWIRANVKLSAINNNTIKIDSLFKIELGFAERFNSSVTGGVTFWYADLMTSIIITKDGKVLKKDSFTNSTPMFSGKREKWDALEDAIIKCEKKLGKILDDYMAVN